MIVVCGELGGFGRPDGAAIAIARGVAAAGASVQLVGIVPDGADDDARLIALSAAGVGHAAVLRSGDRALDRADLELALRYLPDVRVVVAVEVDAPLLPAIAEGAAYTGAIVVVVTTEATAGSAQDPDLAASSIVLQAPTRDADGTFSGFVGTLAAKLDGGSAPADAWDVTVRALAVDAVSGVPGRRGPAAAG